MPYPAGLSAWLHYPQSLTEKLRTLASAVRLELMGQGLDVGRAQDAAWFGVTEKQVFRREIRIRDASGPCWYAMTVIPYPVHEAHSGLFSQLETRSLGELVFGNPRILRESLTPTDITVDADEFAHLSGGGGNWGAVLPSRLSVFRVVSSPDVFYLVEMFLPGISRYCV